MHRFIDGKVDTPTRKQVGLHLATCEECSRLIEGDKFWDEAILKFLDHRAPAHLKNRILGDNPHFHHEGGKLNWRSKAKFIFWQATRKPSLHDLLKSMAIVVGTLLVIFLLPWFIGLFSH
jgi:hypothetical protein